jgi:hypothetical protein
MRIHPLKIIIALLLITLTFAASVETGARLTASARPSQMPFRPQATATQATTATATDKQSEPQPQSISASIDELRATNHAVDGAMDTRIPPATRRLMTVLKHQLRALVIEVLKHPTAPDQSAYELKQQVIDRLKQQGATVALPPFPKFWNAEAEKIISYGYIDEIAFKRPGGHPDLLAVTTALAINCGEDISFYLFRQNREGYQFILALEANGYEEVSGAQSSFDYSISPADKTGKFFVVAADVNAWCTSRWQMLRYKVLRVGATPEEPEIIVKAGHGILIDKEPIFRLTTTSDGFKFTFWHEQSLDGGIQERHHVLNYSLRGNNVRRIAPLALRPEDFLDEWIHLPWDEAAQWAEPAKLTEIKAWHKRLQSGNELCCSELNSVRAYPSLPNRWQVAMSTDNEQADKLPPQLFFKISRKGDAFFIEDISISEDKTCTGRDTLSH